MEETTVRHGAADLARMCRRLVVIPSRQVKALRERHGSAGNEDDAFDADVLRSDGGGLRPLIPDSPATLTLRCLVRARGEARLQASGHGGRRSAAELHRRLRDAPAGLLGDECRARGALTEALVRLLIGLREEIARLEARIGEQPALRWAADEKLRDALIDFAGDSRQDRVPCDPTRRGALRGHSAAEG